MKSASLKTLLLKSKPLIALLAGIVWASFNFCLLEDTFAAPHSHMESHSEHLHGEEHNNKHGHHEEESSHEETSHHKEKKPAEPGGETKCCSDIVAAIQDSSAPLKRVQPASHAISFEFTVDSFVSHQHKITAFEVEFPPGHSPPSYFLVGSALSLAPPRVS